MKTAKDLRRFRRSMSRRPTRAERAFEVRLAATGLDYKRQMTCGFYILDFVVPSRMVFFEIDGPSHRGREWYDDERDRFLTSVGFMPVHVRNEEVGAFDFDPI